MRSQILSLHFFIILISLSLSVGLEVSGECLGDQKSLLLELKNSLIFNTPSTLNRLQWNSSIDCCDWDGVTCDEGHVIGLNLGGKSIIGGLENSSLFNFQHLKSLDLSCNQFVTPIPSRFSNLTNLSFLNLSNAGFVGQIPIEISRLKNLVTLDVSTKARFRTHLLKLENPNLFMLVQNLTKLEELFLDGVNMSSDGTNWCRPLSSSVPNLRVLSLSNCSLSGPVDKSLAMLHLLSIIRLDKNNLSSLVPGFFANFSNLTYLNLSRCQLYGFFPKEIYQVPTLEIIDISQNRLLQGSLPDFSQNNLAKLSVLDISDCQFNGNIPASLFSLPALEQIQLSSNRFTGLVPEFSDPSSSMLSLLDLSRNNLEGPIPML